MRTTLSSFLIGWLALWLGAMIARAEEPPQRRAEVQDALRTAPPVLEIHRHAEPGRADAECAPAAFLAVDGPCRQPREARLVILPDAVLCTHADALHGALNPTFAFASACEPIAPRSAGPALLDRSVRSEAEPEPPSSAPAGTLDSPVFLVMAGLLGGTLWLILLSELFFRARRLRRLIRSRRPPENAPEPPKPSTTDRGGRMSPPDSLPSARSSAGTSGADSNETSTGSTIPHFPTIKLTRQAFHALVRGVNAHRREHPDTETGYALIGKVIPHDRGRDILITGLLDAGPRARFSAGFVEFDREHQQRELARLQVSDPFLGHVGDAHLHPAHLDRCSGGDFDTDLASVRASRTGEMVFAILTPQQTRPEPYAPRGLYAEGLKISFFYLGKASNFEYHRFVPELIDAETLAGPAALGTDAPATSAGGVSALSVGPLAETEALAALFGLPHYVARLREIPVQGQPSRPGLEFSHLRQGHSFVVSFVPEPGRPPRVYIKANGKFFALGSPLMTEAGSPARWFARIASEVESTLAKMGTATGVRN